MSAAAEEDQITHQPPSLGTEIVTQTYPKPDRVTLTPPPGPSYYHSPLDKYKATTEREPQPCPYKFITQRLGLTREEFETELAKEVDETLHSLAVERRTANGPEQGIVLTKEYWFDYFRHREFPTSGQMLGIYRWVASLGIPRSNFEFFTFDPESILLLNAYD